jgi:hypothetical protein
MKRLAALGVLAVACAIPPAANAAPPNPFGHPCSPQYGVLFCPAADLSQRIPTWDGVPIDVDVTLPPTGDGPFPAIVMVHGLGGSKTDFEAVDPEGDDANGAAHVQRYHYNNVFYAQRGYAVMTLSQRGYGRSCGTPDSRTPGSCDRGWQHLDDQAFEGRDIQTLVGMLVDEGVVQPNAIGVTGISYGGGITNELAYLRDRVRLPEGTFMPWTSPNGTPLAVTAAWSRWGWSDLANALAPNGRFLETRAWAPGQSFTPPGLEKKSFIDGLYLLSNLSGFVAPQGADPNADLASAIQESDAGEPYPDALKNWFTLMTMDKSAAGLFGSTPAPLLVEDGFTDDLFPPAEALRIYRDTGNGTKGPVALQMGDLGHGRGANKPNAEHFLNDQGAAFFDAYLKRTGTAPAAGSVTVFTQTCPKTADSAGPFQAVSWAKIHPGTFFLIGARRQSVASTGGDPVASKAFDQVLGSDPCGTVPATRSRGTALYTAKVRSGFTMIGLPLIKATVSTRGQFGQIDAHLYDISNGTATLVTRGGYRLTPNQKGKIAFQLNGNAYRFARGHTIALKLMGRDPGYARVSNGSFRVTLSALTASLPTRERKPR